MDFASSPRVADIRNRLKDVFESHLWCPNDLASLWDRLHWTSKFNWKVTSAPEFQYNCYFCLFYIRFNFDVYVSEILHL